MKIETVPFGVTDWSAVPETIHPGVSGVATWRTVQAGNVRVRVATYSPGYLADHWCSRGHILFVLEGELLTEIQGGTSHTLTAGMSYQVSDDIAPHRSSTKTGAPLHRRLTVPLRHTLFQLANPACSGLAPLRCARH